MNSAELHFDSHQFAARRVYPASAETEVDFSDYKRGMHVENHKGNFGWVPPFAMNAKQLQRVLLVRAWMYVHVSYHPPEEIDREEINRLATAKALRGHPIRKSAPRVQHQIIEAHRSAVQRAGGFLQLVGAIAFRCWRLNMDSVAVADSLGISPWSVRIHTWRLRQVAKKLGFETGRAGHRNGGMRKKKTRKRNNAFNPAEAVRLFKAGMAVPQIATRLGYEYGQGQNRTRRALRKAGVLK